ncbi:MAG TPA: gamma-aminobutyraldehyde dehydrogenase [Acidimicrobiia bacterium]|nr:gamma-aminobutyraldehyde dehydrogenase [Acidimicrobiia bacterium]
MDKVSNFVNGKVVDAHDGETTPLVDPCTGTEYGAAAKSGAADVDDAVGAARAAFEGWAATTPSDRGRALLRIADAIEADAGRFIDAECRSTGKPKALMAADEIPPLVDQLRFFAGAARMLEGRGAAEYMTGHTSYVRREPIGVCAQISPWNYPLMMAVWKIAPALAAGNTVVLKPAETTPATSVMLAELAAEFLPPGVMNVVCGDRETGRALVAHPGPRLVSVTGSVRAGMEVAASAASDLKRVHLELGGNAPAIVCDDADVEAAAEGIAAAGFYNAGQDCTAATRVLAGPAVYDRLVELLVEQAAAKVVGGLDTADADLGPLNSETQLDRVAGYVGRIPDRAEVLTGGAQTGNTGFFYAPTVITGVAQDDEIVQQEVFGPVITVQRFADEADAIACANGVEYGLSSSVWTRDHGAAMRFSGALEFGCVWINTHIPLVAEMPHGGFKHSGYGKDLSMYGLEDYTRVKHVMSAIT